MKLLWQQAYCRQDIYPWLKSKGYDYLKHFYLLDPLKYKGQYFRVWQLNIKKKESFDNFVILEGFSKSFDLYIIQLEGKDLLTKQAILQFIQTGRQAQFKHFWSEL